MLKLPRFGCASPTTPSSHRGNVELWKAITVFKKRSRQNNEALFSLLEAKLLSQFQSSARFHGACGIEYEPLLLFVGFREAVASFKVLGISGESLLQLFHWKVGDKKVEDSWFLPKWKFGIWSENKTPKTEDTELSSILTDCEIFSALAFTTGFVPLFRQTFKHFKPHPVTFCTQRSFLAL